jgi:hypothetical protein
MKIFNATSHQVTPREDQDRVTPVNVVFPVDISEEGDQMLSVDCIADISILPENLNFDSICLFQRWQQMLSVA